MGECLDKRTCLVSLLACLKSRRSWKKLAANWKTLEMPEAILEVLNEPATNWKTFETSETLEELEIGDNN